MASSGWCSVRLVARPSSIRSPVSSSVSRISVSTFRRPLTHHACTSSGSPIRFSSSATASRRTRCVCSSQRDIRSAPPVKPTATANASRLTRAAANCSVRATFETRPDGQSDIELLPQILGPDSPLAHLIVYVRLQRVCRCYIGRPRGLLIEMCLGQPPSVERRGQVWPLLQGRIERLHRLIESTETQLYPAQ